MTNRERVDRGVNARLILDNPAYIDAVAKITQDIRALRLQLPPRDVEGLSRLVFMEQAVERAKRLMEIYLQDGEAAGKELEQEVRPSPIGRLTGRLRRIAL